MLKATDLSKTFNGPDGRVTALDSLSLSIAPGEFVSVMGTSGCGKTTLLLAAGGLLAPDTGTVEIGGCDPYALNSDNRAVFRAANVGFVFQQFHLVPYLSVIDNILAPSIALDRPDAGERARTLINRFNLAGRERHLPSELSTGERQRTALARALLNEPSLILADEPTGNLDGENAEIVLDTLDDFARSGGAVLMVTHSRNAAERGGRTIVMRKGRMMDA